MVPRGHVGDGSSAGDGVLELECWIGRVQHQEDTVVLCANDVLVEQSSVLEDSE